MKREGPPLESPVPWKTRRYEYYLATDRNGKSLTNEEVLDAVKSGNPPKIEQKYTFVLTMDPMAFYDSRKGSPLWNTIDNKPVDVVTKLFYPKHWPPAIWKPISPPDIEYKELDPFPLGNSLQFPPMTKWEDLETVFKLPPVKLSVMECPSEQFNEFFQTILAAYNVWKGTVGEEHPIANNVLSNWMDIFKKEYSMIVGYMERNMSKELNYFLLSDRLEIYSDERLQCYPQEWSNTVYFLLLVRFVNAVEQYKYIIPWSVIPLRTNIAFGKGTVLPDKKWKGDLKHPEYYPQACIDFFKDRPIFKVYSKDDFTILLKKKEYGALLEYLYNALKGISTMIETPFFRTQFNDYLTKNDGAYKDMDQNALVSFYIETGKSNINNNVYTDNHFMFMVFSQMSTEIMKFFNREEIGLIRNKQPIPDILVPTDRQVQPLFEIRKPLKNGKYDGLQAVKSFKDAWYRTADYYAVSGSQKWPLEVSFVDYKIPETNYDQLTLEHNIIVFMYNNQPPKLKKRPATLKNEEYDPYFEKQWGLYMEWVELNAMAMFKDGKKNQDYIKPGEAFKKKEGEKEEVNNNFLDIGIIDWSQRPYENAKWLFALITLTVEFFEGGSVWEWLSNKGGELWDFIKKKLKELFDAGGAEFLAGLGIVAAIIGAGLLALTYAEEKIKKLA